MPCFKEKASEKENIENQESWRNTRLFKNGERPDLSRAA
jgi:hypothetical protein